MSDIQSDNIDMPHNDSYLCCIAFLCRFCVYFLHMMFWTDLIWQVFVSMKRLSILSVLKIARLKHSMHLVFVPL